MELVFPPWTSIDAEIEVRGESLTISDSKEADTDTFGFEGTWRRAKVRKRAYKQEQNCGERELYLFIVIHASETMYASDDPEDHGFRVLDERIEDGYAYDDDINAYSYYVKLTSCRPYRVFVDAPSPSSDIDDDDDDNGNDADGFHVPDISELQIGTRVLYVDPADINLRWVSYVRRRWTDAVLVYCRGPLREQDRKWKAADHHHLCCLDDSVFVHVMFEVKGKGQNETKRIMPITHHLRIDEDFDFDRGLWRPGPAPEKMYFEPEWLMHAPLHFQPDFFSRAMTRHCKCVDKRTALRRQHEDILEHVKDSSSHEEVKACLRGRPTYRRHVDCGHGRLDEAMMDRLYLLVMKGQDAFAHAPPALREYQRFIAADATQGDPDGVYEALVQEYLDTHCSPSGLRGLE